MRGIARSAWTGEGLSSFQALMTSDSADDFVDRMSTLQLVAGHQNGILEAAAGANVAAAQAQATAQDAAVQAQATYDKVAAQQADLQKQVAEYQAVYDRLSAQERQAVAAHGPAGPAGRPSASRSPPAARSWPAATPRRPPIDAAMAQRGKPYVWAASGPGSFDCSGLTAYAYKAAGHQPAALQRAAVAHGSGGLARRTSSPATWSSSTARSATWASTSATARWSTHPTSGDVVKVASIDTMGHFAGGRRIAA